MSLFISYVFNEYRCLLLPNLCEHHRTVTINFYRVLVFDLVHEESFDGAPLNHGSHVTLAMIHTGT